MIPIPKEVYIALGVVLLLAALAFGFNRMQAAQYAKGEAAGSAAATVKCNDQLDKIQTAADTERKRLSGIALDLGLELAAKQRALNQLSGRLEKESENEIMANPAPVVCDWRVERVRIVNDAARGVGASGAGESGS